MKRHTSARIIMIVPFIFLMACAIALFFMLTNVKAPSGQQNNTANQLQTSTNSSIQSEQLSTCISTASKKEANQTLIDQAIAE